MQLHKHFEQLKLYSPSLSSHGKRILLGYFFNNSNYVYNILSYKSLGKG